jgi:hypothetical protein
MSGDALDGYLLSAAQRRKLHRRSRRFAHEGLRELVDDECLGPAARTALRCVDERGADPRLMLLVIEACEEYVGPVSKQERDRQRNARANEGGA